MADSEDVFEMLWDCKYCGQKKLLGITHRFCAGCGAPQDPASRYFPPEEEKVPVRGHPYVGADVSCPACRQPMARAARCCTNCGSPIDKGADVGLKADVVVPPPGAAFAPAAHAVPPPPKRTSWVWPVLGGVVFLLLSIIAVAVFWKREGTFTVSGHAWERNIAVERYEASKKTVWCDETPAGARVVARRREQRGTSKEQDGEVCGMRKKDLGNGSYKQVKECTPKYKDVPVMADRCDVEVTEWHVARTATERGASLAETPRWPTARASGGTCLGCEREGARTETYTVKFVDDKRGGEVTCNVPEARWATFPKGSHWKGSVRVMTSGLDCDNLVAR